MLIIICLYITYHVCYNFDSSVGLQKRSFVILKDEIEKIIICATQEGAGPLLERMYTFLTQKRSVFLYYLLLSS